MKKLKLLLALITSDNEYQLEQASAAQALARQLGIDIEVLFADSDAVHQSQQLLKVLQSNSGSHPDAILLDAAGATGLPHVARAAATAGIAWVQLNSSPDYMAELRETSSVPVFSVSSDNQEVGRIQGRQLAALVPGGCDVLYVQGPAVSAVSQQRASGLQETKPSNVHLKSLRSANWTASGGHQRVTSWLRLSTARNERIDLVVCQNDSIASGARRAVQEQTVGHGGPSQTEVKVTGADGTADAGQEWVRRGQLGATVVVPPNTVPAIEILLESLRMGSRPPAITLMVPASYPSVDQLSSKSKGAHR